MNSDCIDTQIRECPFSSSTDGARWIQHVEDRLNELQQQSKSTNETLQKILRVAWVFCGIFVASQLPQLARLFLVL